MTILTKPYRYQKRGAALLHLRKGRALLADSMGLGKSLMTIMYMDRHPEVSPVIIVCPASLKWNWERELMKHAGMPSVVLEGQKPHRMNGLLKTANIYIINYDILQHWLPTLRKLRPKLIVFDEIHYLKNWKAIRTRASIRLVRKIRHVIGISGTPLTNRPSELWTILHIIWPKQYPRSSWFEFMKTHCNIRRTRWGLDVRGAKNLPQLHKRLKKLGMIRRKKENVIKDLPDKTRTIIPIELGPKARREYDQANKNFIAWLVQKKGKGAAMKAMKAEALQRMNYLKRLSAKLKFPLAIQWLKIFFGESDEKIVIGAHHKKAIAALHKHFPQGVIVDGSVKGRKRQAVIDQFQNDPKTRLFIGNLQAAGVGINLTAAYDGAFFELPWTPGECLQFEDRLHRIGQKNAVHWRYLVAKDTLEERLCEMLQEKQKVVEAVLDGDETSPDLDLFDQLLLEIQRGA